MTKLKQKSMLNLKLNNIFIIKKLCDFLLQKVFNNKTFTKLLQNFVLVKLLGNSHCCRLNIILFFSYNKL